MAVCKNSGIDLVGRVTSLFALAVLGASCSTPTMTVDVVESPELVDRLRGTLVYVEHPQSRISPAIIWPSHTVLVEPWSGASVRRELPAFRPEIGSMRADGTVRLRDGEYSVIEGAQTSTVERLRALLEPGVRIQSVCLPPSGEGIAAEVWRPERKATSSQAALEALDQLVVIIGDRTLVQDCDRGVTAWSPEGDRVLHHAEAGLFEFRATGEPAVRRIADYSDEPVAIGYFDGEPCMALSAKWHPEHEHSLPDWPLRALELPGLYASTFHEILPDTVVYESLPTEGKVVRRSAGVMRSPASAAMRSPSARTSSSSAAKFGSESVLPGLSAGASSAGAIATCDADAIP